MAGQFFGSGLAPLGLDGLRWPPPGVWQLTWCQGSGGGLAGVWVSHHTAGKPGLTHMVAAMGFGGAAGTARTFHGSVC